MVISQGKCLRETTNGDGDINMKVQKFKYLGSVITKNGKCDAEIQTQTRKAENTFERLSKVPKKQRKKC